MRRLMRHPLTKLLAIVAALFAMLWVLPETVKDVTDAVLGGALLIAFTWAIVVMVRRTQIWTHRGLGFLSTITGDAVLYGSVFTGAVFGFRWHFVDLARAFLAVGAVLLVIGLNRTRAAHGRGVDSDM